MSSISTTSTEVVAAATDRQHNPLAALECEPACIYCCGPETD